MTKSQQFFKDMMENHKEVFNAFQIIHDKYALDPKKFQKELNHEADHVMTIIRKYDNMLCNNAQGSKYSKFASKTSETFWNLIRSRFPKIDCVGLL